MSQTSRFTTVTKGLFLLLACAALMTPSTQTRAQQKVEIVMHGESLLTPPAPVSPYPPPTSKTYIDANIAGQDFSGKVLTRANFANADASQARFVGTILEAANFANANLSNASLRGAKLASANLTNANLTGADLTGAVLDGADLTNAQMKGAIILNTSFDDAQMENVDMSGIVRQKTGIETPIENAAMIINRLQMTNPKIKPRIDLCVDYVFNSDKLTPKGEKQLKEIATALYSTTLKKAHILVEGHIDNIGSIAYGKDLSERRAMRIVEALVDNYQIPEERLTAKGLGRSRPVASNKSEQGRALNRRITLVNMGTGKR